MIMGTSLARQCASANPPFKRSRRTKVVTTMYQLRMKHRHTHLLFTHRFFQGKTRTDPVSLQRRKTRHAFTERDRTRKLAARIVEMGYILNAAGTGLNALGILFLELEEERSVPVLFPISPTHPPTALFFSLYFFQAFIVNKKNYRFLQKQLNMYMSCRTGSKGTCQKKQICIKSLKS